MKKIVIIDDEYFFRQALIKYVRSFKDEFTVVGDAGNGKLGIELIEQYHPEIILIDISMPQMTGFDVISYIQKQALQTRFIIISGYDKFEYAQKAIQMGVQDFLLKPVTVESLHKSLRQTSERIDQEVKKDQNLEVLDKKKRNYQNYMRHFAASQFVRKDKDQEGIEAAYIDGCNWIQAYFFVKLPAIKNMFFVVLVILVNGCLKGFDVSYILTGGGPGNATELVATYMYKTAFSMSNFGYGSTLAVFILIESLIAVGIVKLIQKKFSD